MLSTVQAAEVVEKILGVTIDNKLNCENQI